MNEEIERRLRREPGAREHGYVPRALPATLPQAVQRGGTRRPWGVALAVTGVVATAALAVLAVAFVGNVLNDIGRETGGIGSSGSPSASPTVVSQPSPTPVASSGLGVCGAYDFAVSTASWDAAAGSRGTTVILRLVDSAGPCTIGGSPAAGIDDRDGVSLVSVDAHSGTQVTLHSGDMVSVAVSWSNWCEAAPAQPLAAWLALPGGDATNVSERIPVVAPSGQGIPVPPCSGPAQPAGLSVTDFAPSSGPVPQG